MNKHKIASALLAGALLVGAGSQALAADITINGTGTEYKAYKLLGLTTSLKAGTHDDCDGTAHKDSCYNYSYSMSEKYRNYLKAAIQAVKADAPVDTDATLINGMRDLTDTEVRAVADKLYRDLTAAGIAADVTATGKTFSGVDQGYYLIFESQVGVSPDTISLVMLDTMGQENVEVKAKENKPTMDKKIVTGVTTPGDGAGGTEADATDLAVGDKVMFKLTGTMPADIDTYSKYKYIFHDTLHQGLTFSEADVRLYVGTKDAPFAHKVDKNNYTINTSPTANHCSFEIGFDDIKGVTFDGGVKVTKDTIITVTYLATVNANAVSGNPGNDNVAHLEFANDPYFNGDAGDQPSDKTPDDKNIVLTYDVVVNKTDGEGNALAGAEFKLQKHDGTNWVDLGAATTNAEKTSFTFGKLDAGRYKLVETKIPDGYRPAADVEFSIEAVMDGDNEESDDPKLTDLIVKDAQGNTISTGDGAKFTISLDDGSVSTNVVNSPGTELPGAGGSGTYGFYVGGAVILLGVGGVFVVMRKRKDKSPDNN